MNLKNITIYRASIIPEFAELTERAWYRLFEPTQPTQTQSSGLTPPRDEKSLAIVESVGGEWIAQVTVEKRAVPPATVKKALAARLDVIERETGRRPKGKRLRELKGAIVFELLPKAFPKRTNATIWISPRRRLVVIGSTTGPVVDAAAALLVEMGLRLEILSTTISPSNGMAAWLLDGEAPAGFTLDRECELKQPDSEKATIRYARHTLEIGEIADHIRQGKLPTKVAMTWNGRVSFLLTEALTLKKVALLDVDTKPADADEFDGDVAIATGELSLAIAAIVEALGGEV